jgi:cell division FtsZ-interacting protein ZapD
MGNFEQALAEEIKRLREALEQIRDVPGVDVERLKRIAREALERNS